MSNFPIIPTTPPPLDLNDNEEEDDHDFGSFEAVSHEEDDDIDFVDHDVHLSSNEIHSQVEDCLKESEAKVKSDKKCAEECDNDSRNLTENREEFQNHDIDSENIEYTNSLTSNPLSLEERSDKKKIEELQHKPFETDFELQKAIQNEKDDLDFGDFASFNVESSEDPLDFSDDRSDENRSLSFYKSDISFENLKTETFSESDPKINELKESDEEFADFAYAQPVLNSNVQSISCDHSAASELKESDEEFADFSSFQESNETNESKFVGHTDAGPSQQTDRLSQLFTDAFPIEEPIFSVDNTENISKDLFSGADPNSKNLWKNLKDLENASSLKVKWTASHCFQLLLAALNIDPRNILRNPSVPMFASGLGCVLEPTKHKTNGLSSDEIVVTQSESTSTSASIPPVQFDWSSSGLTNPLDLNQKSAPAFDLDFFVTNDDVKNTKRQTDVSNFEDLLSVRSDDSSKESSVYEPKNALMQQILSANSSSVVTSGGSQVLSAEALQVLQELPNLSFMRAKVLMFPLVNIKNT